jgi:hypothetical protein
MSGRPAGFVEDDESQDWAVSLHDEHFSCAAALFLSSPIVKKWMCLDSSFGTTESPVLSSM